jgi:hypothetical protein
MSTKLEGAEGQWYETLWIAPEEAEITMALQAAVEALELGQADYLTPDPFYVRGELPPLSDEDVDRLIAALDEEYDQEIRMYAGWHRSRSGAVEQTDLHRLPPRARRYLAEQIDAICVKHQTIDQKPPVKPEPGPKPEHSGAGC